MNGVNISKLLFWLVLTAGLIITYFSQQAAYNSAYNLQQENFNFKTRLIKLRIEHRLITYESLLQGVKGLYVATEDVSREDFHNYVTILNLESQFSGIQGVGFSQIIPPQIKNEHIESIRKEGFPNYSLRPESQRDLYTSIIYLEPFTERNQLAFGYDMYSEPVRRTAMEQARDLDEAVMSGKVTLVQENEQTVQAGFLMYLPVYRNGHPHKTLVERRANIIGWVYAPFRMDNLMAGILGEQASTIDYTIYDGENATPEALMYDDDDHLLSINFQDEALFHTNQKINGIGHVWQIYLRSLPTFDAGIDTRQVVTIQLTGIAMSILLSLLVWLLANRRERAIRLARRMTSELHSSEASLKESQRIATLGNYTLDIRSGLWTSSEVLDQILGIDNTFERSVEGWKSLVHPEDREMMASYFKNDVLGKAKTFDREYRIIRHNDQAQRWVHGFGKLTRDNQGHVVSMHGAIQDITPYKLVEQALHESEEKYRRLFELSEDPMWLIYGDRFMMANSAAAEILGYEATDALINAHPSELSPEFQPNGKQSDIEANAIMTIAYREGYHRFEWTHKKKNNEELVVDVSLTRIPYDGSDALFCIWRDITERKKSEATLIKLSLAVEQSPSSIIITNLDRQIEYINRTFLLTTGYSRDEVIGQNPRILQSGKTPKTTYDEMWSYLAKGESWHGELINRRKDGSDFIELVTISPVRQDGKITNYLAVKHDITEQKQADERIERLAHFDQLTGLPNRNMLIDHFKYALSLVQRRETKLVVMFLDLDHFKDINDTLGHSIGDQLLIEIAKRLKECIREQDMVSRMGGDEFILILPDTDANGAMQVATKLIAAISQPFHTERHELASTASIGIALYPDDGENFEKLSQNADAAMYRAKEEGRNNFRFFTQEMQEHSARTLHLTNALRSALSRNELLLHYQPQLSIDGRIVGAEALLRWQHPELGLISPAEFIPIAESSGLIIPIGEWVIRTAVRQLKEWMDSGLPSMTMAVNISAVQFRQSNLTEVITNILNEAQLLPEHLEVELTEAATMEHPLEVISVMNKLHVHGIRMSIDDFGTGYSSLSYLKKFKVYKLKIDQSFIRDLTDDPDDKAIVIAIINMAHSLGIRTIAEGVETAAQLECLRLRGCDEIQGYFFSKPLPADQFERFVNNMKTLRPTV